MPDFKYLPGPTVAQEYATLEDLRDSIATNVFAQFVKRSAWGVGETSGQPYYAASCGYSANGGQPYLDIAWIATTGPYFHTYFRFSSALIGMLDPSTWFPGIYFPMATLPQSDWAAASAHTNLVQNIAYTVGSSGMCRSPHNASPVSTTYSWGARAGQRWGMRVIGQYLPNEAEQSGPTPIRKSDWDLLIGASDADDGTINALSNVLALGTSVTNTPQLVAYPGVQEASWGDLGTSVDGLAPVLTDFSDAVETALDQAARKVNHFPPDPVTNAADQGNPADLSGIPGSSGSNVFAAGSALPVLFAAPELVTSLSSVASIAVAGLAGVAATMMTVYKFGLVQRLKDLADWFISPPSNAPQVRQADAQENNATELGRIADALERIADELCRDVGDPLAHPGIVNVTELASQARSEITLRSHGTLVTASTGVIEEV